MEISPEFSTLAVALSIPLLAALVVDPLAGGRMYRRLERSRDHDSRALSRFYWRIIGLEWACAALIAGIIAVSPGAAPSDFGLALPGLSLELPVEPSEIAGAAVGLLFAGAIFWFVLRKIGTPFIDGFLALQRAGLDGFKAMLPRTAGERRLGVAVSVTAGICEELIYRGFLIAFGTGVLGLNPYVAGGLAALLFGAAHLYQGWPGMIRVTCFGILMTALYLRTGSLLIPIAIHAIGDIVSLVVMPRLLHIDRPGVHGKSAQTAEVS
jgi:membrane protease YdiL (CAAX protease family)